MSSSLLLAALLYSSYPLFNGNHLFLFIQFQRPLPQKDYFIKFPFLYHSSVHICIFYRDYYLIKFTSRKSTVRWCSFLHTSSSFTIKIAFLLKSFSHINWTSICYCMGDPPLIENYLSILRARIYVCS